MNAISGCHLRFSLRMLLVAVTAACAWLAMQVHAVDQRDFVVIAIQARGGSVQRNEAARGAETMADSMPWSWWVLGADPIASIRLSDQLYTPADVAYVRSMFPEATVTFQQWIDSQGLRRPRHVRPRPATSLQQDADYVRRTGKEPDVVPWRQTAVKSTASRDELIGRETWKPFTPDSDARR